MFLKKMSMWLLERQPKEVGVENENEDDEGRQDENLAAE
jgi:hypothetical protein